MKKKISRGCAVLLACAIVIELVVLSIVKARMGHTGKEEVTKS